MWHHAVLFPDARNSWEWTTTSLLGIPALVRVLVALSRAGVREVWFPAGSHPAQQVVQARTTHTDLPLLRWQDERAWPTLDDGTVLLGVRGGLLFTPSLVRWFAELSHGSSTSTACVLPADDLPVFLTLPARTLQSEHAATAHFGQRAAQLMAASTPIPAEIFCRPTTAFRQPVDDRLLLASVGKPTDRWHVEWVRRWTFPALRLCARLRLTPNQISILGFLVALVACGLLAQGSYWAGICGALLLYASWVLDCIDGTLARLTLAESAFGQQLDTTLGHLTNLCIFAALIWGVYGGEPLWKLAGVVGVIFGGIAIAQRVARLEKAQAPSPSTPPQSHLRGLLAKINHRDYAVVILLLAAFNVVRIFLWLSMIGVHLYWVLHLWLVRKQAASSEA
jgi:phosphatidylglycerophosphate synthase